MFNGPDFCYIIFQVDRHSVNDLKINYNNCYNTCQYIISTIRTRKKE